MVKWKHEDPLFNDYARQPLLPRQLSQPGPGMVVADLDQDGSEEWVVGCGKGGTLGFFRFKPGLFLFRETWKVNLSFATGGYCSA